MVFVAAPALKAQSAGTTADFAVFATTNGCGAVTMSGGGYVDSFNSTAGNYNKTKQTSGALVGSNGNVDLTGGAVVEGSVAVPNITVGSCQAGKPGITLSGGAKVTNGYIQLSSQVVFPNPSPVTPGTKRMSEF